MSSIWKRLSVLGVESSMKPLLLGTGAFFGCLGGLAYYMNKKPTSKSKPIILYSDTFPKIWARPTKWERLIILGIILHAHLTLSKVFLSWRWLFPFVAMTVNYIKNIDDARDYENWLKCEYYRNRNLPKNMWPYRVRYDWTEYDLLRPKIDLMLQKYRNEYDDIINLELETQVVAETPKFEVIRY